MKAPKDKEKSQRESLIDDLFRQTTDLYNKETVQESHPDPGRTEEIHNLQSTIQDTVDSIDAIDDEK